MKGTLFARFARAVAATLLTLVGSATQSMAAEPTAPPDLVIDLPAGEACAGFDLRIEVWANPNRVFREFTDRNGNAVRQLSAGKGNTLVFTNLDTGAQLQLRPNGAVEHTVLNPDGTRLVTITGHNVLILFPTDVPAGPSTTQYVGRVVFTIDTNGVFTLESVSGTSTDLCAALE